jgi:hypothetical protein
MHFDTRLGKPAGVDRRITVGREHFDPTPCERERRRLARSREPDDENTTRQLQRRKNVKSR